MYQIHYKKQVSFISYIIKIKQSIINND